MAYGWAVAPPHSTATAGAGSAQWSSVVRCSWAAQEPVPPAVLSLDGGRMRLRVSVLTSQERREKEAPQLEKNEKLRNKFEIVKILIGYFLESINFNHQNQNKIGHIRSFLRKISPLKSLKYGMIHIWTYMNHIQPRFLASAVGCRE